MLDINKGRELTLIAVKLLAVQALIWIGRVLDWLGDRVVGLAERWYDDVLLARAKYEVMVKSGPSGRSK